ncbi:MAG: nuclear transport factor 2 family protein [Williamsia sp.]|nr:nuclear transport factor 2 family protein [Williamsia sp.]
MEQNEKIVVGFLKMLETRNSVNELEDFYHPEIEQIEFPNALVKTKVIRNLQDLKDGAERGKKVLVKEAYEIKNLVSFKDTVLLECIWRGTLAIPLGNIPAGGQMTAHFAQVFELKDGKIFRQRNYDCFEPFA